MPGADPLWMRPDWLPTFEVIEWPGAQELQEEHARLLQEDSAAAQSLAAIKAGFANEDEKLLAAERDAARSGNPAPDSEVTVTPPLRRQAQLEVAEELRAKAREALCNHVALMIRESLAWRPEGEAAIKATAEQQAPSTGDPRSWDGRPVEEIENLPRRTAGIAPERAALERDMRTFSMWFLTTLVGHGENVMTEVNEARYNALEAV